MKNKPTPPIRRAFFDIYYLAGCYDRIHPPAPLGGALRLVENSPTNSETPGYDNGLIWDIRKVIQKKGISTIALYVHAPCYIASEYGMNFEDIIREALEAKARLKRLIPNITLAVFCHVEFDSYKYGIFKRTWFVDKKVWEQFHHATPMLRLKMLIPDRVTILPKLPDRLRLSL